MQFWTNIHACRAPVLCFVVMGFVWAGMSAQIPVIKAQLNASDSVFGLSLMVASLGTVPSMWLAAWMDRKLGARSMQIATAAMVISFLLPGLPTSVVLFAVVMFMVSSVSAAADILMNTRISEIEGETRRPLMNLNHAIFSFSYAAAAIATGFAREAGLGPETVFVLICGLSIGLCLFTYCPHTVCASEPDTAPSGGHRVLVWLVGLVVLAGLFTEQAAEGWSALHLERTLGGSAVHGSLGPAVLGLTMGFGRLFGQAVIARVADTAMLSGACLIAAIGAAGAALAPSIFLAYLGFGLMGLGVSVVVPLTLGLVGRVVPVAQRVKAIGHASVVGYFAYFIGPYAMGLTSEMYGLPAAFLLVSACLLAVAFLIVPVITRRLQPAG